MSKAAQKPDPAENNTFLRRIFSCRVGLNAVWAVLPVALAGIGFGLLPLRAWDYWWQVFMGRLIEQSGSIPTQNLFLYTMAADAPSFIQPWLAQVIFYKLFVLGDISLILLVRNVLALATIGGLTIVVKKRSGSWISASLLMLLASVFLFSLISVRTNMFVWPMFVPLVLLGYAVRDERISWAYCGLFVLSAALWANLHGSFVIPAVICAGFGASAVLEYGRLGFVRMRRQLVIWAVATLLSLLAPLLNPQGMGVYRYMFELSGSPVLRELITEWFYTTPWFPVGLGGLFYLIVAAGFALMWRARREIRAADFVLFAGFALVAGLQVRGLLWFALIFPVLLAPSVAVVVGEYRARKSFEARAVVSGVVTGRESLIHVILIAMLVLPAILLQPFYAGQADIVADLQVQPTREQTPWRGRVAKNLPVEATRFLRDKNMQMTLFHYADYSGYLLLELQDQELYPMLFVDQRIELPPGELWKLYGQISHGNGWREAFERYGIDTVLADRESQAGLIAVLEASADWEKTFDGEENVVFERR